VNANQLIKILEHEGFIIARQKGSHVILINEKRVRIVVPMHVGRDLKPGLLRAILSEARIDRIKFIKLLKGK
jgi:predicted RNA binding protein YcfA (HicA-like mRNA interferase family)